MSEREREREERQKAAEALAVKLGVAKLEPEKPRDEGGRFVGVDAGEKGAVVKPKPTMGHMILAHIEDDPSYLDQA